ncbi:MAG: class I SAM-dependent methyltransferase [Fidelibacterota bacterium]|nr:MAG: class I SAM-dependent methyltransferase [Candidatus Neomarinimicrobiota bacterium]
MRCTTRFILLPLLLLQAASAGTPLSHWPPAAVPDTSQVYTYRQPSQSGTGKVYMSREISGVMNHRSAAWLERPARQAEEQPDLLIKNLPLEPTDVVADIGAGIGFLTFRISPLVPLGKCLAVDIQPEMLAVISQRIEEEGIQNVVPVLGSIIDPNLPEAGVDLVLMVDAYHEFSHPREMMEAIVMALKPGGMVVLVEFRGEDPNVRRYPLHKMTEAQARREMAAVGLRWHETRDILPQQHFMIFVRP